jgi:hypothetical protein
MEQSNWINLLVDVCIGRNQSWLQNDHRGVRLAEVESILAGGLILRAITILDDAVSEYIDKNSVDVPERNPKLYHRLKALNGSSLLLDYEGVDQWRKKRNSVGHELGHAFTWEEVDACLNAIYKELNNLNILSCFPTMEAKKTIQRVDPTQPGVKIEQDVIIEISDINVVYYSFGWKVRVGGSA